jgi:hypothetical protein
MVNRGDLDALTVSLTKAMEELSKNLLNAMSMNVRETKEEQKKLKETLTLINKEITEVKELVKSGVEALEVRVAEVERKVESLETKGPDGPVDPVDPVDPVALMHQELHQLSIRKNNVVIHGLEEGELDHEQANKFMMATEPGEALDFQVLYRAGKRGPRPRTLIVKFKDEKQKKKVLDGAKNLKNKVEFKGIALAPDMTMKQREMDKQKGTELGEEALRLNSHMTEDQKKEGSWVVVGRHEKRRLIKKPMP